MTTSAPQHFKYCKGKGNIPSMDQLTGLEPACAGGLLQDPETKMG